MRLDEILSSINDPYIKNNFVLLYNYIRDINNNNFRNNKDIEHLCYINKLLNLDALFSDKNKINKIKDFLIYNYDVTIYKMSKKEFVYCLTSYVHMLDKSIKVIDINKMYKDVISINNKYQ